MRPGLETFLDLTVIGRKPNIGYFRKSDVVRYECAGQNYTNKFGFKNWGDVGGKSFGVAKRDQLGPSEARPCK